MGMHLPATVEESPQPTEYNANQSGKLRAAGAPSGGGHQLAEAALLQCEGCGEFFVLSAGYVFLDDFCCDECIWRLAEQGEFSCGS